MVATREKWEITTTLPRPASYEQMLEFFGIPPATADALNDNITKKRRRWHALSNSGNPNGRAKAEKILALIQSISENIKRGVVSDQDGGVETEIPASIFETLEELWRILYGYVSADDYDEAIRVAREAINRWHNADAASAFAWVVANLVNEAGIAHPQLIAEGLDSAQLAVREQPAVIRNWESVASLLLASGKPEDAAEAVDRAERTTSGKATAMLYLFRTRAMVTLKRSDDAMAAAVRAVNRADPAVATAVRSEATELLVSWAATMLPIKSDKTLTKYTEMVGVAAWCSYGVPEAEDRVRPYRMWATNAGKRVFTGSARMRSFLAVITGFISLPIHNRLRSRPAWQVFNEGLGKEVITDAFFIVAAPAYVQKIHNLSRSLSFQDD